jgi:hypothetical protein
MGCLKYYEMWKHQKFGFLEIYSQYNLYQSND